VKFEQYDCWKHKNGIDAFIYVSNITPDGVIYGNWMIQGVEHWWMATYNDKINITEDQYDNWIPYDPSGDFYDA
jgi:hypothetical protein